MSQLLLSSRFVDAVTSLAGKLGLFDVVIAHEPKAAPAATGLTCATWGSDIRPVQSSGQASVSIRLELRTRIYLSMLADPQDGIDALVLDAGSAVMNELCGGFSLAGRARGVDLFGADGEGLRGQMGYLNQDGKLFRVMDIFVPIVINDLWDEVA